MDEQIAAIVNQLLDDNGGRVLYPQLLEATDFQQQLRLMTVLRGMRDSGQIEKFVQRNAETGEMEHIIRRPQPA